MLKNIQIVVIKRKKICCKNNTGSRLSFSFLYSDAAEHKEKRVFQDRTPQRPVSHRAYLSSVLRRDAPGFIPRENVAGSPTDQPYSTLSGAVHKKNNARAVQDMKIALLNTRTQGLFTTCCCKEKIQVVMYHTGLAQFMRASIFIWVYFNVIEFCRIFTSVSISMYI